MSSCHNILFGTSFLLLGSLVVFTVDCVDPAKGLRQFNRRVIDAGEVAVGTGCKGGVIPNIDGEYLLRLSAPLSPDAHLQFIATSKVDKNTNPATLTITLQPICTYTGADCTLGEELGIPFETPVSKVDENCNYTVKLDKIPLEGGANAITGSPLIGTLDMRGNLQGDDFYCGAVDGIADTGTEVNVDNSTFAATKIVTGTRGADLPDSPALCPAAPKQADAGVPDASALPDAVL